MAKKKKKKFKLITSRNIGIIITLIIALYYLRFEPPIIQLAERKIYDYKVRSRGVRKVSDNVVIIGIDDKSVAALEGKYPINRGYVGECINILTSYYKPKVIGLDFVYPAPADPDGDAYFGQHVAFAKNVVFGTIFSFDPDVDVDYTVETSTALRFQTRSSIITEYGFRQYKKYFIKATDCLMNIPDVCYGAAGFGFVNVIQDSDGPIREAPMVIYFQDQYFPSFDVEIARLYFDVPQDEVYIRPGLGLSIGKNIFLPTNKNMNFLINYYGPHKTFKYYSFIDIMSKQVDKKDIEGKIVIFGVSGTAMTDMQTTPFSTEEAANLPGIEIHANILESIINDDFYLESSSTFFEMIEFLVLILFGVIIIIIISKTNLIGSFVFTGVFTFFYFLISQILFKKYGLILQSVFPVMLVIMVYISVTMYKYIIEEHEKRHIKKAFAQYLSPNVMKEVLDNP
ncbi:CHASE2 domain-containing protein, partial [Candidatus Dependentiae bacterium]|nr:CHASE2 domain-containing protein [Candidatus Dependentiae bacterium]